MNKSKLFLLPVVIYFLGCSMPATIKLANESKSAFEDAVFEGESHVVSKDLSNSEQYRIFSQGASGFVSLEALKSDAEQRANDFCSEENKGMKTIKVHTSKPPHILGNFPRIEITFVCVNKPIVTVPSTFNDVLYLRLINLKKLLDNGVITKEEFEKEKAKILNQ